MAASLGPTPQPPQPDSFQQAVQDAQKDYARLTHAHDIAWAVDLSMTVKFRCSCSADKERNAEAMVTHILTSIRNARGPVRAPRK